MDNYAKINGLAPGMYLQQGSKIKSLSLLSTSGWGAATGSSSLKVLAESVSWVFIALQERREQIIQTPYKWMKGKTEIEDDEAVFGLNEYEFGRIDKAIQLYQNAYYHRQLNLSGRKLLSLAWLNPFTITPDTTAVASLHQGYTHYWRTSGHNVLVEGERKMKMSSDELLRFEMPDMDELWSCASAGAATKAAAEVIKAIDELNEESYGDNNGLPVFLVHVPSGVSKENRLEIQNRFKALFNSASEWFGRNKTITLREGVTVEKLSLTPSELNTTEVSSSKNQEILLGHGVYPELMIGASNKATLDQYANRFALKMAYRLAWIATIVNKDPHFMREGIRLVVEPRKLPVNLENEERRINMVNNLKLAGETLKNAYLIAGVDLPEEYEEHEDEMQDKPVVEQFFDEGGVSPRERRTIEETQKAMNFGRKGRWEGSREREFKSDVLVPAEVKIYTGRYEGY